MGKGNPRGQHQAGVIGQAQVTFRDLPFREWRCLATKFSCDGLGRKLTTLRKKCVIRKVFFRSGAFVMPPGRASEATRPVPTRSPAPAITIGMTAVAFFAAMADGVE